MTLSPGTRLGPYEILSPLGAGGMGEVYKARDTRLDRTVAIKVLPDLFANDPGRLARFEREAKTLASLNHPNIAAIYGLEEAGASKALVLELVEGPTLAEHIQAVGSGFSRIPEGRDEAGHHGRRAACRSKMRWRLLNRLPRRSKPRTSRGSSIAT